MIVMAVYSMYQNTIIIMLKTMTITYDDFSWRQLVQ